MNFLLEFLIDFLILVVSLVVPSVAIFYAVLGMANRGFLWIKVDEGWYKLVMRLGRYHKTLGPGLHWLGWPGVYTLYSRKMVFKKCVIKDDGDVTVEDHNDLNISSFKSTTYPYGIPFKDEEDSHGLHLTGLIAMHGRMVDPCKSFFVASDWFMTMVTLSLAALRQVLTKVSWEEITGQNVPKGTVPKVFGQLLWEAMNAPREGGKLSVIQELRDTYGFEAESVELPSINPPPGWRETTLAPYKAQKEREAAIDQAKTSAIMFDDTNLALKAWLKEHKNATQDQIKEKQRELRDRALAKTSGYQQVDVRGLENASTAVIGGGGNAMFGIGDRGGRKDRQNNDRGGDNRGGKNNRGDGGDNDGDILDRDPTTLSPEDLEKYESAFRTRKKRF